MYIDLRSQKGLADEFKGLEKPSGEEYHIEEVSEERRPFKCVLDVGIVATTVGRSGLWGKFSCSRYMG